MLSQEIIRSVYRTLFYVAIFYKVQVNQQLTYAINNWIIYCDKTGIGTNFVLEVGQNLNF